MNLLRSSKGFTLVELVMVLGMISIFAVLSISLISSTTDQSRFEKTVEQMKQIREGLIGSVNHENSGHQRSFGYLGDIGDLPSTADGINGLIKNLRYSSWSMDPASRIGVGWNGPYLQHISDTGNNFLVDGWGNPFIYDNTIDPATITSYGADGAPFGTGYNSDIVVQIPYSTSTGTLHGVILNSGVAWDSDAQIVVNYPYEGTVTQLPAITVAPGDVGAFTTPQTIPFGVRSAMVYLPTQAGATTTLGPVIFTMDKPDTLVKFDIVNATGTPAPLCTSAMLAASWTPEYASITHYIPMDDCTAGMSPACEDMITGNPTALTLNGSAVIGAGNFSTQGLICDGTALCDAQLQAPLLTRNFTIAFWYNPNSIGAANQYRPFGGGESIAGNNGIDFIINDGTGAKVMFRNAGTNFDFSCGASPPTGIWEHVVITSSSALGTFCYRNGVLRGANPAAKITTLLPGAEANFVYIGSSGDGDLGGSSFDGAVDDYAIWNVMLTPPEVRTVYNCQSSF